MTHFIYRPHRHLKIWLSSNSSQFMNLENQIRLRKMREQNPFDEIHLVYDSSLLHRQSIQELNAFCREHSLIAVDAHAFESQLSSLLEQQLFKFYQDEIAHLTEGGNLAVASDILRWLSPVYHLGTYTDFDFPIDTSKLPEKISIETPLLLNIGSLKMGEKEFIFTNNDYVAIADEEAAKPYVEKVQQHLIQKLSIYSTDFMESVIQSIGDAFFIRQIIKLMENRAEAQYIEHSKKLHPASISSRGLRNYLKQLMSNTENFLDFNRYYEGEASTEVILRLKKNLKKQLTMAKFLFFHNEYQEIKQLVAQTDEAFLRHLMRREYNLYLKSIVVCTTGPIEISKSLFDAYVVSSSKLHFQVAPFSFNRYQLQKSFKSPNSIPLHQSLLGMLNFLGSGEGTVNDSSWLESGRQLQELRIKYLEKQKKELERKLPTSLYQLQNEIKDHLIILSKPQKSLFFQKRRDCKKEALEQVLYCFEANNNTFDVKKFRHIMLAFNTNTLIYSGLFFSQTKKILTELEKIIHESIVFGLTQEGKVKLTQPIA